MAEYDFSEFDDKALLSERKIVLDFMGDGSGPGMAELDARWAQLRPEIERRGLDKARARPSQGPARDKPAQGKRKPKRNLGKLKVWGGIPLVVLDDETLSRTAIRAFGYIASHISTNGRKDYSYGDLAERLGVTRRGAIKAVGSLEDKKYLIVKTHGTGQRGNIYTFGPEALSEVVE